MEVEAWGMVTAASKNSKKADGDLQVHLDASSVVHTLFFCDNMCRMQASRAMQIQHR